MLMKIDKRNKRVFIMPLCSDASAADQEQRREMLDFMKAKFKTLGYQVKEATF